MSGIFHDAKPLAPGQSTGHPERYAPNGDPLIWYPGDSWKTRLAAWREQHGGERDAREEVQRPIESPRVAASPQRREEPEQVSTAAQPRETEYERPADISAEARKAEDDALPF